MIFTTLIFGGIKSKKARKSLVYFALMGIVSIKLMVSSGSCTVAPFPIVIGGSNYDTFVGQIDYHAATDRIVAVGYTKDAGMSINIFGVFSPYIVVY